MRRKGFLIAVVALLLAAPARAQVDEIFAQWDKPESPGCALAVIKDGAIIYKRGYGMADLDHDVAITPATVFHVASVSKQFTAMAVMLLARDGKLSLDDEVRKYVPELRDFGTPITIRHLMHHTSGLRDQWNLLIMSGWRLSEDVVREADVLDLVGRMKALNFKPGDQYLYSNTGYTLLGVIVKRVSGQSLREFSQERIFKPLGMSRTFFRDDHAVIVKQQAYAYTSGPGTSFKLSVPNYDTVGASSLLTTAEDLAKWDQNFYDYRVGGRELIEQMQVPGALNGGEKIDYALGLAVGRYKGLKVVEHSGGDAGYRSHLMRFPEARFSVACLCNSSNTVPVLLARKVADHYLADRLTKEAPEAGAEAGDVTLTEAQLAARVGPYWNAWTEELGRVTLADGKLRLGAPGYGGALVPLAENRFRLMGQPGIVTFEAPAQGARRMVIAVEGRRPAVFEAMPAAAATPPSEYAGAYYSDEIDATYRIVEKDGKLTLTRQKFAPQLFEPAFRDAFSSLSILGTIRFTRDERGRVSGFTLSSGRIRNFGFVRQSGD